MFGGLYIPCIACLHGERCRGLQKQMHHVEGLTETGQGKTDLGENNFGWIGRMSTMIRVVFT